MTELSRLKRFAFYDDEGKTTSLRVRDVLVERTRDGKRYCQIVRLPVSILTVYDTEAGSTVEVGIPMEDSVSFSELAAFIAASVGLRVIPYKYAKPGISAVMLNNDPPREISHGECKEE